MFARNAQNMPITTEITIKGNLGVGGCDLVDLAKEYGTPLWVMDEETLRTTCRAYVDSFARAYENSEIVYASKALSAIGILKILKEEGLSLDVVSGGELFVALQAGFDPAKIYFHGNNKTEKELTEALQAGVGTIVVDNHYEADLLDRLAAQKGIMQNILIRITPGIEAHTHEFIKTGQFDSKFGTHIEQAPDFIDYLLKKKSLRFIGIHAHIGSQILDINPFGFEVEKLVSFMAQLRDKHKVTLEVLNVGGGLGIGYLPKDDVPAVEDYAKIITQELKYRIEKYKLNMPKLVVEPGRSIVGRAGVTLYSVGAIKNIKGIRKYVSVDGGMADNPRPITYQAKYDAVIANKPSERKIDMVTIAGKYCESGDILLRDIVLPILETGDTLVMLATGAYNYAMSSNYNQNPRPAMVLVNGGKSKVLVRRETYADLIKNQE